MIDKTIPNRLQADADQRLVRPEAGEMLDAQNVTIAEGGSSSSGIIKNVRGTIAGAPLTASDRVADDDAVRVIGSVSDPQRGFIYWFVADVSGSSQDAIYQYNTSDDTYRIVFKGQYLDFDPNGFVKGDVVNAAFQQDGVIQSILYFTDNNNPPRKINVDRAISGDYDSVLGVNKDYIFNVIKAAPTRVPTASFSTDETINQNNFVTSSIQFAIQFIYTDGEESAISAYSKLIAPDIASTIGLDAAGSGKLYYEDNVCEINTKFSYGTSSSALNNNVFIPDVEKIRIVFREGNNGAWIIVDEINVSESLSRSVYGNTVQIYNRDTGIYRWYNDGANSALSSVDTNKLYDNVPLQAQGLSVAGNRLMLSNYTEGRENHDPGATISVDYNPARDAGEQSSGGSPISWDNTDPSVDGGSIEIDFLNAGGFSASTDVVPSGTRTVIQFEFDAIGSFHKATGYALTISGTEDDGIGGTTNVQYGFGSAGNTLPLENSSNLIFDLVVENENEITVADLPELVESELSGMTLLKQYQTTSNITADVISGTGIIIGSGQDCTAVVKFDDAVVNDTGGSANVKIRPYVSSFFFNDILDTTIGGAYITNQDFTLSDEQSDLVYSYNAGLVTNESLLSTAFVVEKSFKAGATHELGVVYYDKYNRSGNVNRIGSFYVDHFSERSSEYGSSSVTISFDNDAPEWAERYQIVYPGNSTYSSWNTYTVGGGFFEWDDYLVQIPSVPNEGKKFVYVSLNTLERAKDEKGFLNNYSFTEGDKLRVISYDSVANGTGNPTIQYPSASDGSPIEFNILGVKVLGQGSNNPIHGTHDVDNDGVADPGDPHLGTFLVLEAPAVNGGVTGSDSNDIKYPGFDWFSISSTAYPDAAASSGNNFWGQRCVVEVLTPRKKSSETVWYEIGEDYSVATRKSAPPGETDHGPAIVIGGSEVFFRPVSCAAPYRKTGVWTVDVDEYRYENIIVESQRISDYFGDESWDRGRPHVVFEDSATVRRYNGITYSDAYAEDVANLSLSSFNPSLANFFSLDSANGACNYIDTFRDGYLLAFQENRVSRVGVNKDIITTPAAGQIPSLTTSVLGEPVYYLGDFGCGGNPESVLVRDGNAFFVDTSRKKLVRLTSEGLSPVSENGVDSMFKSNLDSFIEEGGTRIVSGYDPEDDQYYVTLRESGSFDGLTLGYNVSAGAWQSRYTFFPDMYADQNGTMYSAYYNDPANANNAELFFSHDNESAYNTFYGTFGDSVVKIASNSNPSMTKVFNAVSLEGSSPNWVADPIVTDLNSNAQSLGFVEKEGSYYSFITRDENGTKHITGVGRVASLGSDAATITFDNRVNRNPIPYGSNIRLILNEAYSDIGTFATDVTFVRFVDAYTIEVAGTINIQLNGLVGGDLVAVSEATINGDPVRGHWAEITLTNNNADAFELYCVNTHVARSDQDHSLGQQ